MGDVDSWIGNRGGEVIDGRGETTLKGKVARFLPHGKIAASCFFSLIRRVECWVGFSGVLFGESGWGVGIGIFVWGVRVDLSQ